MGRPQLLCLTTLWEKTFLFTFNLHLSSFSLKALIAWCCLQTCKGCNQSNCHSCSLVRWTCQLTIYLIKEMGMFLPWSMHAVASAAAFCLLRLPPQFWLWLSTACRGWCTSPGHCHFFAIFSLSLFFLPHCLLFCSHTALTYKNLLWNGLAEAALPVLPTNYCWCGRGQCDHTHL